MALIVQKFGGSSVADRDRIFNVARIVANTHAAGNDVVVVVSAQGDTTDDLIAKAGEITHDPSQREMDMLLATGEQISISLLAMALGETGCPAISLTGWQAGFHTDRAYTRARSKNLDTERIESELSKNRVVVVAGFQGLNRYDDITTLGRGGSDTSAVAIAAALHADLCQIYTDVDGVYTADPRLVPRARKLDEITFDEMLELASLGAQVLNNRSVELAKKYSVNLEVRSSLTDLPGTIVKEVTAYDEGHVYSLKKTIAPGITFAAFIPDFKLLTEKARAALPKMVSHADAVYNLSRAALLATAFCEERYDFLPVAAKDSLHQQYRLPLIEGGEAVFALADGLGALATFISGAGPTILSVVRTAEANVFFERAQAALESDEELAHFTLHRFVADNEGAKVV